MKKKGKEFIFKNCDVCMQVVAEDGSLLRTKFVSDKMGQEFTLVATRTEGKFSKVWDAVDTWKYEVNGQPAYIDVTRRKMYNKFKQKQK